LSGGPYSAKVSPSSHGKKIFCAWAIDAALVVQTRRYLFCRRAEKQRKFISYREDRTRLEDGVSRRPASFIQADVARILRAAKQVGASSVEVKVGETTVVVSLEKESNTSSKPVRL
jgi:hypothetical protein